MIVAKIQVNDAIANTVYRKVIPAGIIGAQVLLDYADDIWQGLRKTVVFQGAVTKDVITDGEAVTIPAEVVAKQGVALRVGVYGVDADGNIAIPTLWADMGTVRDAADPSGDTTTDPTLPVWAQIQAMIGNLEDLDTTAKNNLVAAVNEAMTKGGGEVDAAEIQRIVEDYLAANPPTVTESDPTVPAWAKQPTKPSYTAAEVGALPDTYTPPNQTAQQVGADPAGTAASAVSQHNTDATAHNDLRIALRELSDHVNAIGGVYYVATDYGINTDAEDNTPALQTLVDTVSETGGGVIFFPVGTYNFKKAATEYAVQLKSNVSIMGENIETTVLKQTEESPYAMFYCMASASAPLTGCCFSNFTVDAYDTGSSNAVYGKAFYVQYLRDCVFRDLRLFGTIATAMGIDYLDRVVIDNVSCVNCGRTYTGGQTGTSGIGIGTGGWEEENFVISNCICVGSGQFGIFIENQRVLGWGGNVDYSKGCIIANCVVRGGLNHGIGIRGGENVTVIGCETYENTKHGIYLDNKCKNVKILNCSSTANGASGVYLTPNSASGRIVIRGCTLVENTAKGIYVATVSDKLCIADNLTDDNEVGLYIGALTLNDCVVKGNAFLDGVNTSATFEGNTDCNDLTNVVVVKPTAITAAAVEVSEGRKSTIVYSVEPSNASTDVTFASSNSDIATVDSDGVVTGIAVGSCNITITSTLNDAVSAVVSCTVVEYVAPDEITILNSDLTVGKKLNTSGKEETNATSGVSDYVEVSGGIDVAVLAFNFTLSVGYAIYEYDSNKTFIARTSIYGSDSTSYEAYPAFITTNENTKYIRLSVNNITTTHAKTYFKIKAAGESDVFTKDNLIADTKLTPDGTTAVESGIYCSDYIIVPDNAQCMLATGCRANGRICTYDDTKNMIREFGGMYNSVLNNVVYDVSNVAYIRFCVVNGIDEATVIAFSWA